MISVEALTAYPQSTPGPRVRLDGYVDRLAEAGVDLKTEASLSSADYEVISSDAPAFKKAGVVLRAAARTAKASSTGDLTLVHRLRSITPIPLIDPPRRLDIYDFDDALHLGSRGANNATMARLKREDSRWASYVRRARLVIAGNSYLADAATKAGAERVEVVPSCVEPSDYEQRKHGDVGTVTVGWIGSASTSAYLDVVIEAMDRVIARGVPVRLVVIGADSLPQRSWLESRPWRLERQAADLADLDIGVMPMPDDPWTRGKCGYKLLQYFAAGVPAIASPVGVAAGMVNDSRGRLASDVGEWADAIAELAADWTARREMGAAAERFVKDGYSYERWAPAMAGMIRELN